MSAVVDVTVDTPSVDVTVDSEDDIAEVVDVTIDSPDVTIDSEDDITEVPIGGGPPLWFHGYRRGRCIGSGASGQVFVCRRKGNPKGFAVKTVDLRRLRLSTNAEREHKKLRREVDILKGLPPHENIVTLIDAFEEGSWFLCVLELVGGGDLFTTLTARSPARLLEREAAFVLRQLADGLHFLHGRGIIHRDLKLENVLVASERRQQFGNQSLVLYSVKITDFGLSKAVGAGFSEARSTVGTRPYTAPEVLREDVHHVSADLWCLGILLHVLLAGHFPFDNLITQQNELDRISMSLASSAAAKSMIGGLLQLDPTQRMRVEQVRCHQWLQDEGASGSAGTKPKRQCPSTHNVSLEGVVAIDAGIAESAMDIEIPATPEIECDAKDMDLVIPASPEVAVLDSTMEVDSEAADLSAADGMAAASGSPDMANSTGVASPGVQGAWTPFAVEAASALTEVQPASSQPDVMQVHMVTPDRAAGFILGKSGARIQEIAADSGCSVWMTSRKGTRDRRVVIMGTYKQCKVAQELVHEQLANALKSDWRDTEVEVLLLVRVEASGVVIGKQGFVLQQIREQSGANIQLLREQVQGQRPCVIKGTLHSILLAEKYVFDLVRAVPTPPRT